MVYMCADVPQPGMHRASKDNLRQMLRIGSSAGVWVVAQIAQLDRWTYRYKIPPREPKSGSITVDPVDTFPQSAPRAVYDFFT